MAENLTGTKPTTKNEITQQINALSSSSNQDQFHLQKFNYNQVLHEIKSIRSDRVIYSKTQSGFCKHHSTNTLLIKIRDNILNALDQGQLTIAVMTDFSKATDGIYKQNKSH